MTDLGTCAACAGSSVDPRERACDCLCDSDELRWACVLFQRVLASLHAVLPCDSTLLTPSDLYTPHRRASRAQTAVLRRGPREVHAGQRGGQELPQQEIILERSLKTMCVCAYVELQTTAR